MSLKLEGDVPIVELDLTLFGLSNYLIIVPNNRPNNIRIYWSLLGYNRLIGESIIIGKKSYN